MVNMQCAICEGSTNIEKIDKNKEKRLKNGDNSLKGVNIRKASCKKCGHTAYIKYN